MTTQRLVCWYWTGLDWDTVVCLNIPPPGQKPLHKHMPRQIEGNSRSEDSVIKQTQCLRRAPTSSKRTRSTIIFGLWWIMPYNYTLLEVNSRSRRYRKYDGFKGTTREFRFRGPEPIQVFPGGSTSYQRPINLYNVCKKKSSTDHNKNIVINCLFTFDTRPAQVVYLQ